MKFLLFVLLVVNVVCVLVGGNLLGGYQEQNASDPKYAELAEQALSVAGENKDKFYSKMYRVATQEVAGKKTFMEISLCDRPKLGEVKPLTGCAVCQLEAYQPLGANEIKAEPPKCLPPFPV